MWQEMLALLERIQVGWSAVDNVALRVLLQLLLVVGGSYGSYWLCHLLFRVLQRRLLRARPASLLAILLTSQAIPRAL